MKLRRDLGVIAVLCLGLCLLVLSDALDSWSPTGSVNKPIAVFLSIFYALACASLAVVARTWKKHRDKYLLTAATVVAGLLFIEVGLRLLHPAHAMPTYKMYYSPDFHHVSPADTKMIFEANVRSPATIGDDLITVETNEIGLRSAYSKDEFASAGSRILFLGDSFTFGLYVTEEQAFPSLVESLLRERPGTRDVAVLNAGVVSYSPFLEALQFRDQLRDLQPTLVVLMLDATDFGDDIQYSGDFVKSGDPRFPRQAFLKLLAAGPSLTDHSALFQRFYLPAIFARGFVFHPWLMATTEISPSTIDIEIDGVRETNSFFIYRHPLDKTRPYFRSTLGHIEEIAEAAAEIGARFLLVVSPRFHHWNVRECPKNWEADQYGLAEPFQFEYFRFFEEVEDQLSFPVFDLLPTFRAAEDFPLVFEDDPHWNPAGHRLVAEALVAELARRDLIR